jgi:hypothetical protein
MKQVTHNQLVVQHMVRTSNIIMHLRNSRAELGQASLATRVFIQEGKPNREFRKEINQIRTSLIAIEQKLMERNRKLCNTLDDFASCKADSIPYISPYDIKNKCVDILRGTVCIGSLDLSTGDITIFKPDEEETSPAT